MRLTEGLEASSSRSTAVRLRFHARCHLRLGEFLFFQQAIKFQSGITSTRIADNVAEKFRLLGKFQQGIWIFKAFTLRPKPQAAIRGQ
jgi:hypothetical protein